MNNKLKLILTMFLVMVCQIVFPATRDRDTVIIRKINHASGESSWKNLTSTATIKLGSKWYFQDKKVLIKDFVQSGDPVEIWLGYNQTLVKRFEGFVSTVGPQIPVEIKCEDYMYKLKRTPANVSYRSVGVKDLLADLCPPDINVDCLDADLGSFKATSTNVAKVLEKIKEQYGLVAYFKEKTLFVGKVYLSNSGKEPVGTFHFQKNIKSNSLVYRLKDEVLFNVEAISNLKSGKKIKVEVGDKNGEKRTLNYYNIQSEEELTRIAERDMEKFKVEGWRGSFNTFGTPFVNHTDVVKLEDSNYPEKDGSYFCDGVSWVFEEAKYDQKVELGSKAS